MSTPGAKMSIHDPKLEKDAFVSSVPVAPTVMASAAEAGDIPQASLFEFPPATATMTPAATALFTAVFIARLTRDVPRLMLMTALFEPARFAWVTAHWTPAIMLALLPEFCEFKTLTEIKLIFLAIPYWAAPTVPKTEIVEIYENKKARHDILKVATEQNSSVQ
jgi:hypothetical protein